MTIAAKLRKIAEQSRANGEMEMLELQTLLSRAARRGRNSLQYDYIVCPNTESWLKKEGFMYSIDYTGERTIISF